MLSPEEAEAYVYLDYSATTPLCEEACAAMAPYQVPGRANLAVNANANSLHGPGRDAFMAMEQARKDLAGVIGAKRPSEVVFTCGATESDNAALLGIAHAVSEAKRKKAKGDFVPHVVTSVIEHDAVLMPVKMLERQGYRVTRLAPNKAGFITPDALAEVLTEETVLVSIQAANSEIGSIQPVAELAAASHAVGAYFHTDATQVLGKIPVQVEDWGVDAASFSAHKLCGPKGVGSLYLRARTPFDAYLNGGGQESNKRSGTQNVAGIVGFAAAAKAAQALLPDEQTRLTDLRDHLYAELSAIQSVHLTVPVEQGSEGYLPNIVHFMVKGFESETLIIRLDDKGFGVSGGSACASHSLDPSHVLTALGIRSDLALGALRISMGRYTTKEDIEAFLRALRSIIE